MSLPARGRAARAENLLGQLEALSPEAGERAERQRALGLDAGLGIYLVFASEPNFVLKLESLDLTQSGIELCNVRTLPDNTMQAAVFVPEGKLEIFLKKVAAYRDEDTTPRRPGGPTNPKNRDLVESVSNVQLAALEALWTEELLPFPQRDVETTWEVWLRRQAGIQARCTGP